MTPTERVQNFNPPAVDVGGTGKPMNTQPLRSQQTQQTTQTVQPQSDFQRLLEKPTERAIEYVPYGSADKLKLSVDIVQKFIATPTKKGATCSTRDAVRFIFMCQSRRLNPFEGDAFLNGYDTQDGPQFSLITAHQAFLKRAEGNENYDGMESGIVVLVDGVPVDREGDFHLPDELVVGGWARVHRKGRSFATYRRIRMARFNSGFAQWKVDPAGMICKCAEADALRSTFPTMLGGLHLTGELQAEVTDADIAASTPNKRKPRTESLVSVVEAPQDNGQQSDPAEADAGLAPAEPKQEPETKTPQVRLADAVTAAGFNFGHLQAWGSAGAIPDADSMSGFREIPTDVATRLLLPKALKAVLDGCAQAKGGGE